MAKYKVKTAAAVIDRHPAGSTIVLPKETAESLADKGYVDIISEVKTESEPKKAPKKPKVEADNKEDSSEDK